MADWRGDYIAEMTLEMAEKAIAAARSKAKEIGAPMAVSVVDGAGRLVMFVRGEGTGFFTPESTKGKAVAAAALRRPTAELGNFGGNPTTLAIYASIVPGGFWPASGGCPVVRNGQLIGAVGCGGGSGEQDHECAQAGVDALTD
ncbi:MAG: hypothetical protein BZY82_09630 [SAR202 cluster bacterium Io17-Chloro-G3]|nr:MAG: hypothetical protein BZY82_09630 [SAR202 cluster bacterium Io17-Chloro-G3]